jgi:hypothetical protein
LVTNNNAACGRGLQKSAGKLIGGWREGAADNKNEKTLGPRGYQGLSSRWQGMRGGRRHQAINRQSRSLFQPSSDVFVIQPPERVGVIDPEPSD